MQAVLGVSHHDLSDGTDIAGRAIQCALDVATSNLDPGPPGCPYEEGRDPKSNKRFAS